jgi:pilus assembly protein CpaB
LYSVVPQFDLEPFARINPCGYEGLKMTQLSLLGGPRTPESFAGWVAKNPIAGGEPVTESKIIAPGNRGYLAAVLRPGMRAISIPVTITSGISGFIFPGDEVDILLTYAVPSTTAATDEKDKKSSYDHKAAETVLRTVRVVAIDQRLESKAGEAVPAHTATFEVTPKQSEVILLASEIGKVSLILRSLVPDPPETPEVQATVPPRADAPDPNRQIVASPIAAPGAAPMATPVVAPVAAPWRRRQPSRPPTETSGSSSGLPLRTAQAVTVLPGPPTDSAPAKSASGGVNEISKLLPQPVRGAKGRAT